MDVARHPETSIKSISTSSSSSSPWFAPICLRNVYTSIDVARHRETSIKSIDVVVVVVALVCAHLPPKCMDVYRRRETSRDIDRIYRRRETSRDIDKIYRRRETSIKILYPYSFLIVWVCSVSLLQYIGKEKCEHSLRSENQSAKHVLLDARRRSLCVWCRPWHEVVSTFESFQWIGTQSEAKAIRIWKDRSTISEHGKLKRWESNEQTELHSRCQDWRNRVNHFLCTGTCHLNWSGHLLKQEWTE